MIPFKEAWEQSARNPGAKWPKRSAENRLEPECWPVITPSFKLKTGARIFTIGSCFARNIETHLDRLGFDIPTIAFLRQEQEGRDGGAEMLNKYTPPSMYQELSWTKAILDRDDQVHAEDVEPFLLPLANGNVLDLQRRFIGKYGQSFEQALAQRRRLYDLFKLAFSCDALVITLGLIECWWDDKVKHYVEFYPMLKDHPERERFFFKRLTFADAYRYTADSLDLLDPDRRKPILLTTSPIPFVRTYTADDVIVANTYSKSVLRAVSGQLVEERSNVDYFPSYESVTLTRDKSVWLDDLAHVDGGFIGRIMLRVTESYVTREEGETPGISPADYDLAQAMINAVRMEDMDKALKHYQALSTHAFDYPDFHATAARLLSQVGKPDLARHHAEEAERLAVPAAERGVLPFLVCSRVYRDLGMAAEAARLEGLYRAASRKYPLIVQSITKHYMDAGRVEDALRVMRFIETDLADNLSLQDFIAANYCALDSWDDARRLYRRLVSQKRPDPAHLPRFGLMLMNRGERVEGLAVLKRAVAAGAASPALRFRLGGEILLAGDTAEALGHADQIIAEVPEQAIGHVLRARCLMKLREPQQAVVSARTAVRLEPGNERYRQILKTAETAAARMAG